jgi:rhodanese-related sulfurtransferase
MRFIILVALLWLAWEMLVVPMLGVRAVSPAELGRRLAAGWKPIILDVRSPKEFAWFRLPGSVNRPWPFKARDLAGLDPGRPLVVVCMTGHRSPLAARALRRAGFKDVVHLRYGAGGWAVTRQAIEKGEPGSPA